MLSAIFWHAQMNQQPLATKQFCTFLLCQQSLVGNNPMYHICPGNDDILDNDKCVMSIPVCHSGYALRFSCASLALVRHLS